MLRSHLVDRTIQKPSSRLGVSRSNLRWGHPALRPAANAHPEDRERERRARRRRGGREGTGEKEKETGSRCSGINCCWLLILYVKLLIRM